MEKQIISIPKPCHRKWDSFSNEGVNKFCDECQTTIYDFTKMSPTEISKILLKNKKVCAKLNKKSIDIEISKVEYLKYLWLQGRYKAFILLLISCLGIPTSKANDIVPNKDFSSDNKKEEFEKIGEIMYEDDGQDDIDNELENIGNKDSRPVGQISIDKPIPNIKKPKTKKDDSKL